MRKAFLTLILFIAINSLAFSQSGKLDQAEKAFHNGNYEQAVELYNSALDNVQNNKAYIYAQIGFSHLFLEDYDPALNMFNNAIREDSTISDYYNGRGLAYAYLGQVHDAIDDFSKAIELDPEFSQAYLNRGSANSSMGEFELAIEDLKKAEKHDNSNPEINYHLGRMHYMLKEFSKAEENFTNALNKGLNIPELYKQRANARFQLEKFEDAVNDYTEVLEMDSSDTEAINNRAVSYQKLGKNDKAEQDRKLLAEITGVKLKRYEEIAYKKYYSMDSTFSVMLPDDWNVQKTEDKGEYKIIATMPNPNKNARIDAVNIKLSDNHDMGKKFDESDPGALIEFWKGSLIKNNEDAAIYNLFSQKQFQMNGWQAIRLQSGLQHTSNSLPLVLYELGAATNNRLFYGYFQSADTEFEYFDEIFKKVINSIEFY